MVQKEKIHRMTVTVPAELRATLAEIERHAGITPTAVIRQILSRHLPELRQYADQLRDMPPGNPYRASLVGLVHTYEQHGNLGVQA